MKRRRAVLPCIFTVALLGASLDCTLADDTARLWHITTSLGLHTTEDQIRNNANLTADPRPAQEEVRAGTIEDGLSFALQAGFHLNGRFALQLETGWFEGDIGPVDVYLADQYPVASDPRNPSSLTRIQQHTGSYPAGAGRLTEIPVSLSLEMRFRKDKPLSPFLSIGGGYIFTDVRQDEDLDALNRRLASLRVREVFDEQGHALSPGSLAALRGPGRLPPSHLVRLEAEDAPEWHLAAGAEYFLGPRSSVVLSAGYTFSDGGVTVLLSGEDQVSFLIFPEPLFRPDGSLKIFNDAGLFPNPYIDGDPAKGLVKCTVNTVGDFDKDGHRDDYCYRNDVRTTLDDPGGRLLVQGGRIEYGGFRLNMGLRFYF
jgi:hypothetical protein